jgi:hypothetical protein
MEVVITRHLFSFILAGVVAASTIFPASAWSRDSFISGGEEYESSADVALSDDFPLADVYAVPRRARMVKVSAEAQQAAETNTTGKLVVPATLPTSVDGTFQVMSKYYNYQPAQSNPPLPKFEADYWRDVVSTFYPSFIFVNDYVYIFTDRTFSYSPTIASDEKIRGLAVFCDKDKAIFPKGNYVTGAIADVGVDSWTFTLTYDVSSYSSSAFSLDGIDCFASFADGPFWPDWGGEILPLSVDLLVDGQQVLSLFRGSSNTIDFGGYVFSGSSDISSVSFRWHMPFLSFVSDDLSFAGNYSFTLRSYVHSSDPKALTISFLDGQDVINAQNDKTKSDINKHEEYESQWTGSMTENFNKLDFGNFSFTAGMLGGLNLVSGLFMDVWNALGGGAVIYVFPLYLGLILLLVGRISRSGGKFSSSGKGDDTS